MSRTEVSAPPFLLLCMLFALSAMFIVSFHGFMDNFSSNSDSASTKPAPQALSDQPTDIANLPDGGPNLALTEQQTDALTELMRKLQANPNDAEALIEIGDMFLMAREWQRAEAFLNRAIMSRPSDIRPRYMAGICLYQQGKMQEAATAFEELLEMKEDPTAMYNLAVIYKYQLDKRDQANSLLQKIINSPAADVDTIDRARNEL